MQQPYKKPVPQLQDDPFEQMRPETPQKVSNDEFYKGNSKFDVSETFETLLSIPFRIVKLFIKIVLNIKYLSCLFLFLIVGCAIAFAALIFTKPSSIWDNLSDFLNSDVEVERKTSDKSIETIQDQVNSQISQLKNNPVKISETDLTVLADNNFEGLQIEEIDIEENIMLIYFKLDETIQDKPIFGQIKLEAENGEAKITRIGTERIAIPGFLNNFVTKNLLKILQIKDKERSDSLLLELIGVDSNFVVNDVQFLKDEMVINVDADVNFIRR